MLPNTALNLQEQDKNTLKDFINVAGPIGVTHFLILSATEIGTYLRLIKVPQGPTFTFKVNSYTLQSDLARLIKNVHTITYEHKTAPILIMNNFNTEENHVKLMALAFQNLFPAINIKTVKLDDCKRVVILHYDKETETIEFRHYVITVSQLGMSKSIKRVIQRKVDSLSNVQDISEYILNNQDASESDVEDINNENKVIIDSKKRSSQNAIKLKEIGPRMQLKLLKIEEGVSNGTVLYHSLIKKSEAEQEELQRNQERKRKLREERRKEQERNVKRKKGIEDEDEIDYDADVEGE